MSRFEYTPYKVALVALDLTAMDDALISYTAMISKILPLERIFFVHIAKELELPEELLKKYPDLVVPLDESLEARIRDKVEKYFTESAVEIKCIVQDGHPINKILKLARIKQVNLILMGRKKSLRGSGLVSSHIARKCPCSLLLVTESFNHQIGKVLVPVDFSAHSQLALKHAHALARRVDAGVFMAHIYSVPTGFSKTGKTYDEFALIMKHNAEQSCRKFLSTEHIPEDIPCDFLLSHHEKYACLIYNHAKAMQADLIVLGSKGRTRASAMLIGSQAEKLVFQDVDIPVLIIKGKEENLGFMEALRKI